MALNLPSLKPRPSQSATFQFEDNASSSGNIIAHPYAARAQLASRHPLEQVLTKLGQHVGRTEVTVAASQQHRPSYLLPMLTAIEATTPEPSGAVPSSWSTVSLENEIALQRSLLMHAQGPAGPMIQAMELRATSSVGRLPFLSSSNFQRDVLTGKDEEIDFEDVFGYMGQSLERSAHPHTVMDTYIPRFGSF